MPEGGEKSTLRIININVRNRRLWAHGQAITTFTLNGVADKTRRMLPHNNDRMAGGGENTLRR